MASREIEKTTRSCTKIIEILQLEGECLVKMDDFPGKQGKFKVGGVHTYVVPDDGLGCLLLKTMFCIYYIR
jgi:hypothetical protein